MGWDTLLSPRELLVLLIGSLLGVFLGWFFFSRYVHALLHRFFGVSPRGNLEDCLRTVSISVEKEERQWLEGILALLDHLGVGGAFLLPEDTRVLLNRVFSQSVGLRGKSIQEVQAFEIPVFGEALLQAFASEKPVSIPQSGFTLSPVPLGKYRLLLLEDERKKMQRLRSLRYFLTALWHELQTPLTVLSGYVSTLEEGVPVDGEILSRIARQTHRLRNTLREMQKLSLLLEGKREPVSCKVLLAILEQVVDEHKAKRADVTFIVRVEGGKTDHLLPLSEGEAFVLLANLVANASTFSVPSKEVEVVASCGESGLSLVVANTAALPDAEFLSWFFDPTSTLPRGSSGKGVGLYLVREVVEESGGEIRLRMQDGRVALEVFLPWKGDAS